MKYFKDIFWLSKTLQRYENKSKSQLSGNSTLSCVRCLRLCKDTKIKANHNQRITYKVGVFVV